MVATFERWLTANNGFHHGSWRESLEIDEFDETELEEEDDGAQEVAWEGGRSCFKCGRRGHFAGDCQLVYDQPTNSTPPQEVPIEIEIMPLTFLAAQKVVHKFSSDPQKYAQTLLEVPWEVASIVISATPPTCVECLFALRKLHIERNGLESPALVQLLRLVFSINEYEFKFFEKNREQRDTEKEEASEMTPTSTSSLPQSTFLPFASSGAVWSEPLIDVWGNYSKFLLEPRSIEEDHIGKINFSPSPPFRPQHGEQVHSVADEATFRKNFNIFTEGQFEGWNEWQNMVVVGGSVVGSLLPVPEEYSGKEADYYHSIAYPTSDIDIYIYGLGIEQFAQKIERLYRHLLKVNGEVLVIRTTFTVTFCSKWPKRHIQIVIGKWHNLPEVLFEPDIDCTCVAFDGSRLWATQRARFSFNFRAIVASSERYSVRGFPEYESRLLKYSKRGFNIWYPPMAHDFSNISLQLLMMGRYRICEHGTIEGRTNVTGLRLLLVGYLWPKTLAKYKIRFFRDLSTATHIYKDEGLPYGPKWSLRDISKKLAEPMYDDSNYGPYKVESPYILVQDILDWQSIVSPHRDKLLEMRGRQNEHEEIASFHDYISTELEKSEHKRLYSMIQANQVKCYRCRKLSTSDKTWIAYPEINKIVCEDCHPEALRTSTSTFILASSYPLSPPPATSLFLQRAGDAVRAQELAQEQGIDLKLFVDDPYANYVEGEDDGYDLATILHKAAFFNDVFGLRDMCASMDTAEINATNNAGQTALHIAAMRNNDAVVMELLRAGATVDACDTRGMTALHCACLVDSSSSCVAQLLAYGANANAAQCGLTPLCCVLYVATDIPATVRLLIRHGADIEGTKNSKETTSGKDLTHPDIFNGINKIVEQFEDIHSLAAKRKKKKSKYNNNTWEDENQEEEEEPEIEQTIDWKVANLITPLHIAIGNRRDEEAAILMDNGADRNARGPYGISPLMLATRFGNLELFLVKGYFKGCEVDARSENGQTALLVASCSGSSYAVEKFLEAGADENVTTEEGHTPLTIAVKNNYQRCIDIFAHAITPGLPLLEAAKTGKVTPEVKKLVTVWAQVEQLVDENNWPPLVIAAKYGNVAITVLLLVNGANISRTVDLNGFTALHIAALYGNATVLTPLLAHNAPIDPPPLPYVRKPGDPTLPSQIVAKQKFKKGKDNREDEMKDVWITPLYLAVQEGHEKVVEKLVDAGAQISKDIVILAAQKGNANIVSMLLGNVNLTKEPLITYWAALNGHQEVLELLIKSGYNVNGIVGDGMTLLHCAAIKGNIKMVAWLVEEGKVDVNAKTEDGMTAIHFAAGEGSLEIVEYLVNKGAKLDMSGSVTPLSMALQGSHTKVVKYLQNR